MEQFEFARPEAFWLFAALLIPLAVILLRGRKMFPVVRINQAVAVPGGWKSSLRSLPLLLRFLVLMTGIVALAGPRSRETQVQTSGTEGIDIVLAVDVSASMLARDLRPNRLEALKNVADEFVAGRTADRLGLVVYAGESYTQVPLTTDRNVLRNSLSKISYGGIKDGTAIGMGLATAVNRLKESEAKSKVIILLTDGENNSGFIDPNTAAELAAEFNIRTYTIGVGTKGVAPTPVAIGVDGQFIYRDVPVRIDEKLLTSIAEKTGGKYFRATDNRALQEVYAEIDQLERTELSSFQYYNFTNLFRPWLLAMLGLFLLERLLSFTVFKSPLLS